ncbi:MAG: hypothetical protein LBR34_06335 [Prevotella sp.]|jgi:hypothetical protein|nr:hypothetical protein [Prevotella sp.]
MKNNWLTYCFCCFALAFTGCDLVHYFPDDDPVNPYLAEITVTVDIDMQLSSDTIYQTYASMLEGDYDIRYIVDLFEVDNIGNTPKQANRVKRIVKTESNIVSNGLYHIQDTLRLPLNKYLIMVWMDFVDKGSTDDKYYNTDDLQNIAIIMQNGQYTGYNTTKDAFTAKVDMDLTPYAGQRFVHYEALAEVIRPFAIYRIITTDIQQYMTYHQTLSYSSIKPATTNLAYNLFFPLGYNAFLFKPDNYRAGIGYRWNIIETLPEQEAILASDYVFVEDDTFYTVDFEVFSAENKHINTVRDVRINLKRNHLTILRDEFLTKDLDDGNVGIDDRFSDEIIVRF